jgi:hypothetical protein
MVQQVEVFTAEALVTGSWPGAQDLREALESSEALEVANPAWTPLRRPPPLGRLPGPDRRPAVLPIDDIIAVVGGEDGPSFHASWHDVVMGAGPYRIQGQLGVLPGFDPGRALTRPGGTFLLLRHVGLQLIEQPEAGELERDAVLVNRYAVERIASDLELGFFFPAAHVEPLEGIGTG